MTTIKVQYKTGKKYKVKIAVIESKEMETTMEKQHITLPQILDTDEHQDLRKVVRLLQKLEIRIGGDHAAETYLNKQIQRVNKKYETIPPHYDAVVGYSLIARYKEEWKCKQIGRGINFEDLNEVYSIVEKNIPDKAYISPSMDLADELYRQILK